MRLVKYAALVVPWAALVLGAGCAQLIGLEAGEEAPAHMGHSGGASAGGSGGTGASGAPVGGAAVAGGSGGAVTGGSGGAAGSSGADTGGSGGAVSAPTQDEVCDAMCAAANSNCTGQHQVYISVAACKALCLHMELGQPGDQTGPSAYCRLTNAELAASTGEPQSHCPAVAPGGGGICGVNCENYCTLVNLQCVGQFASRPACLSDCAGLPVGGYDISVTEGNSLQCRFYHLNAATESTVVHCPHAAGAAPCQ